MDLLVDGRRLEKASHFLCKAMDGQADAALAAASVLVSAAAGFVVLNGQATPPIWLADNYVGREAKEAVQRYVNGTYLLNPIWNAVQSGLKPGVYRMSDLAPDHWASGLSHPGVTQADDEEIGYLTPGWPEGLSEVSLLTELPNGVMAEISIARRVADGGFSPEMLGILQSFMPLFDRAQLEIAARRQQSNSKASNLRQLEDFGKDSLSPREAEILRLVLKGHSSLSISLLLDISVPTVKTHRQNGYAKLKISTQQELFHRFLQWVGEAV